MSTALVATMKWKFLSPFAKKWNEEFFNDTVPKAIPYVDELRLFSPTRDGVLLFLDPYGEDIVSFDREAVLQYCQDSLVSSIREQSKPGSAWLDDRTFSSYYRQSTLPLPATPDMISVAAAPEASSANQGISRELLVEYVDHALGSITPPGVARILDSNPRATSNRYIPNSRRYPAPLTAELLYDNLKKKVVTLMLKPIQLLA